MKQKLKAHHLLDTKCCRTPIITGWPYAIVGIKPTVYTNNP